MDVRGGQDEDEDDKARRAPKTRKALTTKDNAKQCQRMGEV